MRLSALFLLLAASAHADSLGEARQRFVEGAALVKNAQWAEAEAAFEKSARLHPHAVTTFNIAACERAMGRYTRARALFRHALEEDAAGTGRLPESLSEDARALVNEIDNVLARIEVTIDPAEAAIAVDGRPLAEAQPGILVAGMVAPGPGAPAPSGHFTLLVDPGSHVFLLTRKGFSDVALNRSFAPGARGQLKLQLDRLPATLHVAANRQGAVVSVDGKDVGGVPVAVERPAGSYRVTVQKSGFNSYEARVTVRAGEAASLMASLEPKKTPIYKKWWFWSAAAVVVAGVAVGTYFGTREPPQLDGGGLQWTVKLR
jgi:tetratricopeptide (TPR) repeat protein